jgi:hypothetical protein
VVARGRWSSLVSPLVCGRAPVWWCSVDCPVARPNAALRRVMGLLLRESGRRESKALLSGPRGSGPSVRKRSCRTAGCERGRMPLQVATLLRKATDRSPANTERRCRKKRHRPQRVCRQRGYACGSERLQGSQTSLNSNCQKNRRKLFSSPTTLHVACKVVVNAFQQYEWLARLATAKL